MRELDFVDFYESALAPTIGDISANGLRAFVDDAAFLASKEINPGVASVGDLYFNTTLSLARICYNGTDFASLADVVVERAQIALGTANHVIINDGTGALSSEASLDETRGGTGQITFAKGDLLYASAVDTLSKLAAGTADQILKVGAGLTPEWKNASVTSLGKQETLGGLSNNSNLVFGPLSFIPLDADSIVLFKDGIFVQNNKWTYLSGNITLDVSEVPNFGQSIQVWYLSSGTPSFTPPPAPTGTLVVQYPTLSGAQITAKKITLSATPAEPTKVILDIPTGTPQIYGTDFVVTGNEMSWAGLGLDGVLTAGDVLRYWFFA